MQNYVEFNGEGRGDIIRANGVRWRPLQKNTRLCKKIHTFREVCPQIDVLRIRITRAYHMVSWPDSESQNVWFLDKPYEKCFFLQGYLFCVGAL